jgi:hypothetical protein
MCAHETLPQLAVMRDCEVEQFVDDHVLANVSVQAQKLGVKVQIAIR